MLGTRMLGSPDVGNVVCKADIPPQSLVALPFSLHLRPHTVVVCPRDHRNFFALPDDEEEEEYEAFVSGKRLTPDGAREGAPERKVYRRYPDYSPVILHERLRPRASNATKDRF